MRLRYNTDMPKLLYKIGGAVALIGLLLFVDSFTASTDLQTISTLAEQYAPVQVSDVRPASTTTPPASARNLYTVIKVVDGDTVTLSIKGVSETIRLIGVDTPETVDPRKTVQCFGREASDKTKSLLTGRKVTIEKDPTQGDRDRYGRLLAYVYRDDGLFVNKYLVEYGYGHEYTYHVPYKYQTEFKVAQKTAESRQRGLWAAGVCDTSHVTASSASAPPTALTLQDVHNHAKNMQMGYILKVINKSTL